MSDTYSDRLRLILQATGNNANTWGVLNNANLGTLIEAAIAGVATVAMPDANYTLTENDGAADESRCAVLVLTGALTASRDVIIPGVQKLYVIDNRCDQAVVVKVLAQAGVTVPVGVSTVVWCDGATTRSQITGLGALAVAGALSVGGALSAASAAISGSLTVAGARLWSPGDIKLTGRTAPETGWLFCDGAAVSRATYADLYAAIGVAFGAGDGTTTFNVPDLRGRAPYGRDNMGGTTAGRITATGPGNPGLVGTTLGAGGGADRVALTVGQLAVHGHATGTANTLVYRSGGDGNRADLAAGTVWAGSDTFPWSTQDAGAGEDHPSLSPALICNYVVKV